MEADKKEEETVISESEPDDNYDPHEHRQTKSPTNNFETLVHLLKCSIGTGILAMPQAFVNSGLITGAIATLIIGVIITHCLHVLVKSQYILCKRKRVPLLTYSESMVVACKIGPKPLRGLSRGAAIMTDVFLVVYQLGIGCVYFLFIAKNNKMLIDPYYVLSFPIHMVIILGPLIAINCIPNLKALAPFSVVANILTFIGLGIVLYYLVAGTKTTKPLDYWGSISTFPLFFGTVLFALTAVGVVIALENNMKTPKAFGKPFGVLNIGMCSVTAIYFLLGALGYVYCGQDCHDSITLDLPHDHKATKVALVAYVIAIFISYALQCYVPVDILWNQYLKPKLQARGCKHLKLWEYVLRIALCFLTFSLAISVPALGLFISLFGAVCLSALGLIFPAFMEICASLPKNFGPMRLKLVKDIVIMIIGVIGLFAGGITTIYAIIQTFM
ncbi:proton-coupled amino acid transporter-like protein CG1139 [Hyposmocoma kahamanoa]|uniref:proton-coupled amino acid transporter-like protein CG1139 n=1 Tax=Hyposmocoma kahamanoa TaxID=1477025 RepID=UPI000E6DA48E|nr:proton-coupled amino acid transporter-like protein CG1139 [Hyposmocoma kahamanoa]XP_026328161.1 proton-coupled amino acid transporter-like protein CG1139 [Hyposmocoma kahamanoa]